MQCRYLFKIAISFPLDMGSEVGSLDHMLVLFLIFWGTPMASSDKHGWQSVPGPLPAAGMCSACVGRRRKCQGVNDHGSSSHPLRDGLADWSGVNHVRQFVTPWTVALQAPLFMGFPSKNLGVGCHLLLQGIFLTQGSNRCLLCLLHWQVNFLPLPQLEMEAKYLLPHLSGGTTGTCSLHSQTPSRSEPSWPWDWPAPMAAYLAPFVLSLSPISVSWITSQADTLLSKPCLRVLWRNSAWHVPDLLEHELMVLWVW